MFKGSTLHIVAVGAFMGIFCFLCAPVTAQIASARPEQEGLPLGWKGINIRVNGTNRHLIWRGPEGPWKNGAIIALHGGGGNCANWGADFPINRPMEEFVDLAVANGFAVFAPDSTQNVVTDGAGNAAGKRFDCIQLDNRPNVDLPFIEQIIVKVISDTRPDGSAQDIFMTGISNGGFMTILAATYFDDRIVAFAPVSAGDPYGTHMDCTKSLLRQNAPGLFIDNETGKPILGDGACLADTYTHEKAWHSANPVVKPAFKQFHNAGDIGVDISCMKKIEKMLVQHGYRDDGPYILQDGGGKNLLKHFWSRKYNQPMVDFFIRNRKK